MKRLFKYFSIIALSAMLFSCDQIDEPYVEENAIVWNGRKTLILDFTGHHCPNCPEGHRKIEQLQETFPDAIVPVAIHATYFSRFNEEDDKFNYNFTTPIGTELGGSTTGVLGYFSIPGLPLAAVNTFQADGLTSPGNWATEIAGVISSYPEVEITIESSISNEDGQINADITVENLIESSKNLSMGAYLVESGIITWQEDNSAEESPVEDYEHNHVLRYGFNGSFGESINANNAEMKIGNEILSSYAIEINDVWNLDNCSIIAFVYDTDTKEVLQAEEMHLEK